MPSFDEHSWRFPFEQLVVKSAVLCLYRSDDDSPAYSDGGRIEFEPVALPDINSGYAKTEQVDVDVLFELPEFEFESLQALAGRAFVPDDDWRAEHPGSVSSFGAHNPVDTIEARFGEPDGKTIPVALTLRFDFDYEGRIGGVVEHTFDVRLTIERRWET
jgi:hypothetical protein